MADAEMYKADFYHSLIAGNNKIDCDTNRLNTIVNLCIYKYICRKMIPIVRNP